MSIYQKMYDTDVAHAYYVAAKELYAAVLPSRGDGIRHDDMSYTPSAGYNAAAVAFYVELSNSINEIINNLGGFVKRAEEKYLKFGCGGMIECDVHDADGISEFRHRIINMMNHFPSYDEGHNPHITEETQTWSCGPSGTLEYTMIARAIAASGFVDDYNHGRPDYYD